MLHFMAFDHYVHESFVNCVSHVMSVSSTQLTHEILHESWVELFHI